MAHQVAVADEQYEFKSATRNKLYILLVSGLVLFGIGLLLAKFYHPAAVEHHGSAAQHGKELVASVQHEAQTTDAHEAAAEGGEHAPSLTKRILTTLWMNNVFFTGLGIIGLFFVA